MNIFKRNKILINLGIVSLFSIFAYLMILPLYTTGKVAVLSDFYFHAARVEEIFNNLKHGEMFTFIATLTFQHTGVGSFLFYPTLFLYPWAILRFFFNPINSFYMWYWLITVLTFVISYYCMFKFSKNRLQSLIFSFLYVLMPYHLYLGTSVFGEFIASMFLPIIFLGAYYIFYGDYRKWYFLSIGMALLGYSHILSVFMTCEVLVIIFIILLFIKKISIKRIGYILISAIVTLLMVLPVIYPFITDFIGKNISSALPGISPPLLMTGSRIFESSISNEVTNCSIGVILLVTLFFGYVKEKPYRFIYYLGILCVVISTNLIPWMAVSDTFLGMVQLPFRYLMYAGLFLATVCCYKILMYMQRNTNLNQKNVYHRIQITLIIFGGSFIFYYGANSDIIDRVKVDNSEQYLQPANSSDSVQVVPNIVQLDKNNYRNQFGYAVLYGETDYYPKVAIDNEKYKNDIINNIAVINKKEIKITPISQPNQLIYDINVAQKSNVDLPVIAYTNTKVNIDGKNKEFTISDRGTVNVKLSRGEHTITVGYEPPKTFYRLIVFSIFVIIGLCVFIINNKINSKRMVKIISK